LNYLHKSHYYLYFRLLLQANKNALIIEIKAVFHNWYWFAINRVIINYYLINYYVKIMHIIIVNIQKAVIMNFILAFYSWKNFFFLNHCWCNFMRISTLIKDILYFLKILFVLSHFEHFSFFQYSKKYFSNLNYFFLFSHLCNFESFRIN